MRLAELLTNLNRKVDIFLQIATYLAAQPDRKMESDQFFIRANEVAKTIPDAFRRERALSGLAQALAQAGQWERAEASIAQIEDAFWRGEALLGLIDALTKVNNYERGLAIAQRSWLQTTTKHEALDLLKIANPFIVLKPELGGAFLEAFS